MRNPADNNKYVKVEFEDESEYAGCPPGSLGGSSCESSPLSSPSYCSTPTELSGQSPLNPKNLGAENKFTGNTTPTESMASSSQNPIGSGQSSSGSQRGDNRKRKPQEFLVLDEKIMEQEERKLKERGRKDKLKNTRERSVLGRQQNPNRNKDAETKAKGIRTKQIEDEDVAKGKEATENEAKDQHGEATTLLHDAYRSKFCRDLPHECSLPELNLKGNPVWTEIPKFESSQPQEENMDGSETIGVLNLGNHPLTLMPELWKDGEMLNPHDEHGTKVSQKKFDAWIEPYFKTLTYEDRVFLEDKGDMKTPFVIPDLGQHYSKTWTEEDGSEVPGDKIFSKPPLKSPVLDNSEEVQLAGHAFRPLTARLFALILPEDPEDPDNVGSKSVKNDNSPMDKDYSSSEPEPRAYTTTLFGPNDLSFHINEGGPTDERLAQELRYIGFLDKDTTYDWEDIDEEPSHNEINEEHTDEISTRLKQIQDYLKEQGLSIDGIDEDLSNHGANEEPNNDETDEESNHNEIDKEPTDEISIRLKQLQDDLKKQCVLNIARKERISEKMERYLVHQQLIQRFEPLDRKINDMSATFIKKSLSVYKRFQTLNKKGMTATGRGKRITYVKKPWPIPESVQRALRARKLLVGTSNLALNGEILGALPIENTFDEMNDLMKKVEEILQNSSDQEMVDLSMHEGADEEWEDEDEEIHRKTRKKRKMRVDEEELEEDEDEEDEDEDEDEEEDYDDDEDDDEGRGDQSWGEDKEDDEYVRGARKTRRRQIN